VRRHDLDWVALIAGLVFTGLALAYVVVGVTDVDLDGRYVWPVVLVALGAAGVATAVSANAREERVYGVDAPPPGE
jgi:uncharacterized integral membrane protein